MMDTCFHTTQRSRSQEVNTAKIHTSSAALLRFAEILYKCTLCRTLPSILTSKENFVCHIHDVHLNCKSHLHACQRCELKFGTVEDLKAHTDISHNGSEESAEMDKCSDGTEKVRLTNTNTHPRNKTCQGNKEHVKVKSELFSSESDDSNDRNKCQQSSPTGNFSATSIYSGATQFPFPGLVPPSFMENLYTPTLGRGMPHMFPNLPWHFPGSPMMATQGVVSKVAPSACSRSTFSRNVQSPPSESTRLSFGTESKKNRHESPPRRQTSGTNPALTELRKKFGRYISTISIFGQSYLYCQVCAEKFEEEADCQTHFSSEPHKEKVATFENALSASQSRTGRAWPARGAFPLPNTSLATTCTTSTCVRTSFSSASPGSCCSSPGTTSGAQNSASDSPSGLRRGSQEMIDPIPRSRRKRTLPKPFRKEMTEEDSSSSVITTDSDTESLSDINMSSGAHRFSLMGSDKKRLFLTSRHEDPGCQTADASVEEYGSCTAENSAAGSNEQSEKYSIKSSATSMAFPLSCEKSMLDSSVIHYYPNPLKISKEISEAHLSENTVSKVIPDEKSCDTGIATTSTHIVGGKCKEGMVQNDQNVRAGNTCAEGELALTTLIKKDDQDSASSELEKQPMDKISTESYLSRAEHEITRFISQYSSSVESYVKPGVSPRHCFFCNVEFWDMDELYRHNHEEHSDVSCEQSITHCGQPEIVNYGEQYKVNKLKEVLREYLSTQQGGCVSRDELLEKISEKLNEINDYWGPACNRAVRELFPDSSALRKGKHKKTYFFGVRSVVCEVGEDLAEEEFGEEDHPALRNMSQDLEALQLHLPGVVCWTGHMDSCITRDEVLQLLSSKMSDGDVLNWGMQCNRAMRQLFPEVYMKRKGKYKTTCFYGVELIAGKSSEESCSQGNMQGPPVVNVLDFMGHECQGHCKQEVPCGSSHCLGEKDGRKRRKTIEDHEDDTKPTGSVNDSCNEQGMEGVEDSEDHSPQASTNIANPSDKTTQSSGSSSGTLMSSHQNENLEKLILLHPGPFVTARIFSRRFQRLVTDVEKVADAMAMLQGRGLGQVFTMKQGRKVFFKAVPSKSLEMRISAVGVRFIDYQVMFRERDPKLEDTLHDRLKAFYPHLELLPPFYKY